MKNNMMIKSQKNNIFRKILNFFKKSFCKNQIVKDSLEKNQETIIINNNDDINKLKQKRKIIDLQIKYENNIIKEEELTEEEKENLINLYKEQISTLEDNIQIELKKLEFYRQKILDTKKNAKK
ncbi:MAG: hypothetical protein IKM97_00605 [Clostridia bacterium]|nr:hypothetical protein [Clostridia bacterium]